MPHGAKILGEAGKSLADIYDVEGSVVDIEELDARVIQAVHELGEVINSERMGVAIIRMSTGDLLQTITFDVVTPVLDMPGITRVLGVMVFADGDRVLTANVNLTNGAAQNELALWWWDPATDLALTGRVMVLGSIASRVLLRPSVNYANLPTLATGPGQRAQMPAFSLRGITTTFGAGTVEITAHILIANADVKGTGIGAPSNIGLPMPSW